MSTSKNYSFNSIQPLNTVGIHLDFENSINFRYAVHSDLPELQRINAQHYDRWNSSQFAEAFKMDIPIIVACNSRQQLIGYAVYFICLDEIRIINLTIAVNQQGQGYGKKLLQYILNNEKSNARWALLDVRTNNFKAINLYTNLGFSILCRRKSFYLNLAGEDAYLMQLDFSDKKNSMANTTMVQLCY